MRTNVILESVSLMVDTENSSALNTEKDTKIYVCGYIRIDKEGNVLEYKIEQEGE